jgi:hypothetical protein
MHNNQHNLKTHNMSKLLVIVLSIILLAGISLVPTLEIKVQGQVRQSPAPPSPGGSPSTGTPPPPSSSPAPPSPGGSPSTGTPPPPSSSPAPPSPGGSPSTGTPPQTTSPGALDTADGGGAANQTAGEGGGGAVNQSAIVMIPQSTMQMIMSQLQDAMTAIDSNNKDNATKAMNSVDQELKSAANASGISIETTTG